MGESFDARCMRVGSATRCRLLENALDTHAIFRPVDDHGRAIERHGAFDRREIAIDRVIFVVGEIEDPVVDAAEAFLLHHRHVPLLKMQVSPGASLSPGELLETRIDFVMDATAAITTNHEATLEL